MTPEKDKVFVNKIWGGEEWIENNDKYCLKRLNLKKNYTCSYHHHKIKDETFFVDSGMFALELEGTMILMKPGSRQRIMPGQQHRFIGLGDSRFYEVSTHHDDSDSYRVEGRLSGRVGEEEMNDIRRQLQLGLEVFPSLFNS